MDLNVLDRRVSYTHVSSAFPALVTGVSSPDWLLYLAAARGGFDAFVTRDLRQFDQREEMVALWLSGLTLITWTKMMDDPVTEWGQLLAYGPQLRKALMAAGYQPTVFRLPVPRLAATESATARERIGRMSSDEHVSVPELRDQAVKGMRRFFKISASPAQRALVAALDDVASRTRTRR